MNIQTTNMHLIIVSFRKNNKTNGLECIIDAIARNKMHFSIASKLTDGQMEWKRQLGQFGNDFGFD